VAKGKKGKLARQLAEPRTPDHSEAIGRESENLRARENRAAGGGGRLLIPHEGGGSESAEAAQVAHADREKGPRSNFDRSPYRTPNGDQVPRSPGVAYGWRNLREHSTEVEPFSRLEQWAGGFIGQAAFGGLHQDENGVTARVSLDRLAGTRFRAWDREATADPGYRDTWHIAQGSATPANGSHDNNSDNGQYPSRAMKNATPWSEAVKLMRELQ